MANSDELPVSKYHPIKSALYDGVRCAVWLLSSLVLLACSPAETPRSSLIKVDGSSTLFALIETFAELNRPQQNLPIVIGNSGTGSGLNRFCRGELDIATASRSITKLERQQCQQTGIEYVELPITMDAITIIVNPKNTWIDCISPEQLKQMWQVQAQYRIKNWQQIDPLLPARPLHLYGPGTHSGTYDYFSRVVTGKARATRGDYAATEDDNLTVQGVAGDINALGFLGMGYWADNKNKLKALGIKQANGDCTLPELSTIKNEQYKPLSRSLYLYVSRDHYQRNPTLRFFITQMLDPSLNYKLSLESGFIPLSTTKLNQARRKLARHTGFTTQPKTSWQVQ